MQAEVLAAQAAKVVRVASLEMEAVPAAGREAREAAAVVGMDWASKEAVRVAQEATEGREAEEREAVRAAAVAARAVVRGAEARILLVVQGGGAARVGGAARAARAASVVPVVATEADSPSESRAGPRREAPCPDAPPGPLGRWRRSTRTSPVRPLSRKCRRAGSGSICTRCRL